MCGTCSFSQNFMNKVINKTVKDFQCIDEEIGSEVTIIFTDDTKIVITWDIDNIECEFNFYKYSKELDKWIYI